MKNSRSYLFVTFLCLTITACNTTSVRTTQNEKIIEETIQIPEDLLLDVGVAIFDPNVEALEQDNPNGLPRIREAEARFMPFMLVETLQHSGNWGIVRIIPDRQSEMDLWVDTKILESDGATLKLQVSVQDSSGKTWFTKTYSGEASSYSYDARLSKNAEPFQSLYNQITNDMLLHHRQVSADELRMIRIISEIKFAKRFSSESFEKYLATDNKGYLYVTRLPADDDPVLLRVKQIRQRDYVFVDTIQDYYDSFVRQMDEPYREWRRAYYEEGEALRKVQSQSNQRMIGGALAVLAGILAQGADSRVTQTAGTVGIGAGAGIFMSGLNKREEAKVHAEALEEISNSLDAEIEPHTMALEDRSVTLSGSVNNQYGQWREILKEIYETETGQTVAEPQL